jgi:hypothetical protein
MNLPRARCLRSARQVAFLLQPGKPNEFRFVQGALQVNSGEVQMGRGILLWLLGIPIPIIILLALIWH